MLRNPLAAFLLLTLCLTKLPAQSAGSSPAKINISPVNVQNRLGSDVPVQVQLQDANGHPAAATRSTAAQVKVQEPSGETATYSVTFAPGETAKQISVPIGEAGVAKLSVQQSQQQLIGASSFVLVRPAKSQTEAPHSSEKKTTQKPATGPGAWLREEPLRNESRATLRLAAFAEPQVPVASAPSSQPNLALTVSGEDANGGTRSDGTTCAVVQVFYLGADDPQRDIQIWLSPSNGILDNNPIVIPKGSAVGKACWTSQYPIAAATLGVAATNPANYTFVSGMGGSDPKRVTHKFTDDIRGIEFVNPPQSITIVDSFNLTARFKGPSGPVQLSDSRDVHFSTDSAVLNLSPLQTTVRPGGFDSSTVLVPTYFGKSTVQAFTPNYPPVTWVITITFLGVLIASLLGGLIGGILSWINSQGNGWARVFTGLAVGLVASWAYVMVGLPKLETAFLHNQLSVFFVALIVGFSGVKGLTFISSKLNFPSF